MNQISPAAVIADVESARKCESSVPKQSDSFGLAIENAEILEPFIPTKELDGLCTDNMPKNKPFSRHGPCKR